MTKEPTANLSAAASRFREALAQIPDAPWSQQRNIIAAEEVLKAAAQEPDAPRGALALALARLSDEPDNMPIYHYGVQLGTFGDLRALVATKASPSDDRIRAALDAFTVLRQANIDRQSAWTDGQAVSLLFRATELGGETGEVLNVCKKIERERSGWRGSRATVADLAEELADVIICADLLAMTEGIDLWAAVVAKFNATSEKVGLPHRLALSSPPDDKISTRPGVAQLDAQDAPSEGSFRERPVVIEAIHYTDRRSYMGWGQEVSDRFSWLDEAYDEGVLTNLAKRLPDGTTIDHHINIRTLEGVMRCNPGDWLIRGINGELYPCKPDIFAATYETVDDGASLRATPGNSGMNTLSSPPEPIGGEAGDEPEASPMADEPRDARIERQQQEALMLLREGNGSALGRKVQVRIANYIAVLEARVRQAGLATPQPPSTPEGEAVRVAITALERPPGHCNSEESWRDFVDQYGKLERKDLCGGTLTDFEAAYKVAMVMRSDLDHEASLHIAKDRIRWLSIRLAEALTALRRSGEGV